MGKIKLNTRRRGVLSVLSILGLVIGFFAAVGVVSTSATAAEGDCDDPTITETETVMTDPGSPAVDPVPEIWEVFSPNDQQGPFEGPPNWPSDNRGTWQAAAEEIPPGHEGPDGVYQQGDGNASWFYRQAGTEGSPAVPPTFEDVTKEVPNPNFPCAKKPPKKPPTEVTINKPDKTIKITEEGDRVVTTFDGPIIEEGL